MNRIFNGKEIDDSTSELARTLEMEPKESREPDKTFELKAIRDLPLTPGYWPSKSCADSR
jgi:hypothetical protein